METIAACKGDTV